LKNPAEPARKILSFRIDLLRWFETHQRRLPWRETKAPYRIWVSEVMLQQTRVNTVIPYYERFLSRFPDLQALAASDLQSVLKLWEGLGYYARARNLHRAAREVMDRYGGRIPEDPGAIRTLPGIGDYIGSALLSIAFGKATAVVDGNVKRVLARLYADASPVNQSASHKVFKKMADRLIDPESPGAFNQAMMELGAAVCRPKGPDCGDCPVRVHCLAHATGSVASYPKRVGKNPTPRRHLSAGVVYRKGQVLIAQRRPEGLLGGLWEFPSGEVRKGEDSEAACSRILREVVGLTVEIDRFLTTVAHAYTHFRITMDVYCCFALDGEVILNGPADHRWVAVEDIPRFPFPKANLKFIPLLRSGVSDSDGSV